MEEIVQFYFIRKHLKAFRGIGLYKTCSEVIKNNIYITKIMFLNFFSKLNMYVVANAFKKKLPFIFLWKNLD